MNEKYNQVRVFACGGMASNVVSELEEAKDAVNGFAQMLPCYIDTSMSNLRGKNIPEEQTYIFEATDGSGKVRSTNYEDISKNAKAILQKFKPTTFNVVVHSAAGGSGAIISSVLVSELKARGIQVVVIVVGSTDTRIEIDNTIKTLKTYESIAEKRISPVVVHYLENTRLQNRFEINKQVKRAISLLMGLFSGQNDELDTADLKNWLEYTVISNTQPRLASLSFAISKEEIERVGTPISVATLAMPEMNTRLDKTPAYQAVGYAPSTWRTGTTNSLQIIGEDPIHYCINDDFITASVNALKLALKEVDDAFSARTNRVSILDKNDNRTDTGIIL